MYYLIYKITNIINNKIYIGSHKTKNKDDKYMGSGKYLNYAIKKHGLENFTKEILFEYDNPIDMFAKEAELVDEDFIAEANTYNLKVGGFGGFDYINNNGLSVNTITKDNALLFSKLGKEKLKILRETDPTWCTKTSRSQSDSLKGRIGGFKDKVHTDITKKKQSIAHTGKTPGYKNSQYGTCWITNLQLCKSIKIDKNELDSYLSIGWIAGRKLKF